jgi:hypothetical protein
MRVMDVNLKTLSEQIVVEQWIKNTKKEMNGVSLLASWRGF